MVTFPNAKINLGLYVERKRSDGYHDISTVMLPVEWCDILEIVPANKRDTDVRLFTSGNRIDCPPEKNIVIKAVRALENITGTTFNIDIYLRKIIPDGAGLGGGSSDASFTLRLINEIFELNLNLDELMMIASKIGADCAFFIKNEPMLAQGIGEILTPVKPDLEGYSIIIVKPEAYISTAQAYAGIVPRTPELSLKEAVRTDINDWKYCIFNVFEEVAFNLFPELEEIKSELYKQGALYASMSGSGSAFYGIFKPDYDNLTAVSSYFSDKGYQTFVGKMKF